MNNEYAVEIKNLVKSYGKVRAVNDISFSVVRGSLFAFLGVNGVPQADGSVMSLANAAWIWVPLLAIATIAAWSGISI